MYIRTYIALLFVLMAIKLLHFQSLVPTTYKFLFLLECQTCPLLIINMFVCASTIYYHIFYSINTLKYDVPKTKYSPHIRVYYVHNN